MISPVFDKFQQHPRDVGETYWEHFCHALWFASRLFVASGACIVHAIVPFLFTSTGSTIVSNLYLKMVQGRSKVVMGGMDDSVDRRIASDVVVSANSEA